MTKYFIYSIQEMEFKKAIAKKSSKSFKLGYVTVKGIRKPFTSVSNIKKSRYSDAEYIEAEVPSANVSYTMPRMV